MTQLPPNDDLFVFQDEEGQAPIHTRAATKTWKVLIVDDDPDVHQATLFALKDTQVLGRPLQFLQAYSAKEAQGILQATQDIAVILLDVVMETPNAGLDLVAQIRGPLGITSSRIILRTGEPNQAPELQIIRDFDINDYKLKSELSQKRLFASLTAAIRSYRQICTIEASKKGLDMILRSSSELLTQEGLQSFAQGVIVHIAALLGVQPEGIICVRRRDTQRHNELLIIAAAGDYCPLVDRQLCDITQSHAYQLLNQSIDNRCNVFAEEGMALYLGSNARGDMSCYIASGQDVAEMEQSLLQLFCGNISICADNITYLEQLKHYAYRDPLVNLPNRIALEQTIDQSIREAPEVHFALAIVDIDHFAEINASLGQEYGDKLLMAAAERLKNKFSPGCHIARIAADVFAVFGPASHITEERLLWPFNSPFEIAGEVQLLTVTCGVVPLDNATTCGTEAIKYASILLKNAKRNSRGMGVAKFDPDMMVNAQRRLHLLKSLRNAFERQELFLAFQPKLCAKTLTLKGFEALLRWRNERGLYIPPVDFIPLAEQSGLIVRMGEWVLSRACAALKQIDALGFNELSMAVNLSVAQLQNQDLLPMLQRVLGETQMPAHRIELEVTESVGMGDIESNIATLQAIKHLGVNLAIDDFGTGFSSLSYLQKMPIDCLKIDKSFVQTLHTTQGKNIVQMIIQLARTLDLTVVAEGVETPEQAEELRHLHCDLMQGYLYAKPMALADCFLWLQAYKNQHPSA